MDKQTTIAFILIGAILVLWLYISAPDPKQQLKQNKETTQTTDSIIKNHKDSIVVSKTIPEEIQTEKLNFNNTSIPEEQVVIETQLARFELSNKGATSGSRVAFIHPKTGDIIRIHKPHPHHEIGASALKDIVFHLKDKNFIKL